MVAFVASLVDSGLVPGTDAHGILCTVASSIVASRIHRLVGGHAVGFHDDGETSIDVGDAQLPPDRPAEDVFRGCPPFPKGSVIGPQQFPSKDVAIAYLGAAVSFSIGTFGAVLSAGMLRSCTSVVQRKWTS